MKLMDKLLGGLKGKDSGVPDIGQEEVEAEGEQMVGTGAAEEAAEAEEAKEVASAKVKKKTLTKLAEPEEVPETKAALDVASAGVTPSPVSLGGASGGSSDLKIEKLTGKIDMLDSLIKGVNERLSVVGQQLGEVRNMNIDNEKSIVESTQDASKAVDIVKEVKPEELRVAYQKMDLKIQTLNEKLEANREFNTTLMTELKDLKGKAGLFVGTEGVLKLNEDVKKDLIEVQKMSSKVRLNADKSEQIFMEVRKGFAETQKLNKIFTNLDTNYGNLREQIEKLKVDFSGVVSYKDFSDNQKKLDSNFSVLENSMGELDSVVKNNVRLSDLIEKVFMLAKNNEKDVANIAVSLGDTKIKKVSDYEHRFHLLLALVDEMSDELRSVKKKIGVKVGRSRTKRLAIDTSEKESLKEEKAEEKEDKKIIEAAPAPVEVAPAKKSFFKRLFSGKEDSPLEADAKSELTTEGEAVTPQKDDEATEPVASDEEAASDSGAEETTAEDTQTAEAREEPSGEETTPESTEASTETTQEESAPEETGTQGTAEVSGASDSEVVEATEADPEIDKVTSKRDAIIKKIDEEAVLKESKLDESLGKMKENIGALKSVKVGKTNSKKISTVLNEKAIKQVSKKAKTLEKLSLNPVKKKRVLSRAKKVTSKAKKIVSKTKKSEKVTSEKKIVDKRLLALAKGRKVHMMNLAKKKSIKENRLKALAKARKVHMQNLKDKKKAEKVAKAGKK